MDPHEWTWRCAEKLHQQWPRVDPGDLVNVAEALQREDRWKGLEPGEAAQEWLRLGIPSLPQKVDSANPRSGFA